MRQSNNLCFLVRKLTVKIHPALFTFKIITVKNVGFVCVFVSVYRFSKYRWVFVSGKVLLLLNICVILLFFIIYE